MNNSLFPDADPSAITWTGPPPEIVTVQCLLYASLATSLFAAFLAMLGKQWVNRYLRNHGGSAGDKSRDRQRKLDGSEKWHFYLVIEGLPVMLQLALMLLGCALSRYLWTISRTVAGVILAFTLFGVTCYVFFTLAATLCYNCPYQTPPSLLIQTAIRYLTRSDTAFARSLRSIVSFLPSTRNLGRSLNHFCSGVRSALENFRCIPAVAEGAEHIPVAAVVVSPSWNFEDISINWDICNADARCVSWVLHSTTDADVILSTVKFAADMIWYPEIAGALSPHILADLCECISDGSKLESPRELAPQPEPMLELMGMVLNFVMQAVLCAPSRRSRTSWYNNSIPEHLPTTHKLWLSRVVLQTLWRWRCVQGHPIALPFFPMDDFCKRLMADGGQMLVILKTNCFLTLAIYLGLQIDIHDLYAPHNKCVLSPHLSSGVRSSRSSDALQTAFLLFHKQLQMSIQEQRVDSYRLAGTLRASNYLGHFHSKENVRLGFLWITEILNSRYPEDERYLMASRVVQLLGNHYCPGTSPYLHTVQPDEIPPLLDFLSLCERFNFPEPPPHPGSIALRVLLMAQEYADFGPMVLPVLSSTLLPTHPLQSRSLALRAFYRFIPGWFSSRVENVLHNDLNRLLQAVGDPFQFTPMLPLQDWDKIFATTTDDGSTGVVVVLIEFASSNLWQNHIRRSNFTSCEEVLSTEKGRRTALDCMLATADSIWPAFLRTPAKIIAAIRRLEELQCLNTAEIVIIWDWTSGVIHPADGDAWKLIGDDTFRFYRTHGIGRLAILKRCIADTAPDFQRFQFLTGRYEGSPYRIGGVQRPAPLAHSERRMPNRREFDSLLADLRVSQACLLRMLYHLFGYDPTARKVVTGEGAVVVEEVDDEFGVLLGRPVPPVPFVDWACDYP